MKLWRLYFLIVCALINFVSQFCLAAEPSDRNPRAVYFSVADTQDVFDFPPLDLRDSIAMARWRDRGDDAEKVEL